MSDRPGTVVEVEAWIAHLVPRFLENRARDIVELRQAIAERDFAVIGRLGHNLKGVAGGYGFTELAQIGERLEAAGADRSIEPAAVAGDALERYVERVTVRVISR